MAKYDFSGWATKNNIRCSDGRIIRQNAFIDNDGSEVPLVWNHLHNDPNNVLGHALLENRDEGVYAYCTFNDTKNGRNARELVQHGDVTALSIYANKLKQNGGNVLHGQIREVSLVLAGANPGASIDSVISHGEELDDEAIIYNGEYGLYLSHSDDESDDYEDIKPGPRNAKGNKERTIQDVIDEMTEEQRSVLYALVGQALQQGSSGNIQHSDTNEEDYDMDETTIQDVLDGLTDEEYEVVCGLVGQALEDGASGAYVDDDDYDEDYYDEEDEDMKHNVFDNEYYDDDVLMHTEIANEAIRDFKEYGSMRESFLAHAAANNIENLDYIFPEAHELNTPPKWINDKKDEWVNIFMNAVTHTPFSRVKTTFAEMTFDQARAKGYIKGNMKKDIAMTLLKRVTTPTTIYIKNKIDRDDLVDITDFDVVMWQKAKMRKLLDKELCLAMLLGDGRETSDEDKINEQNVRPILTDEDMFTIKYTVTKGTDYKDTTNSSSDNDSETKGIIRAAIRARKDYRGSGNPTFFTTEDTLTSMLLIEDQNGRLIYDSQEKLATALRCSKIVTVPEMESHTDIYGIIVNPTDYTAGADKGGSVNMFDDFDIDYNQMKYLMETRMSGALTEPYSAIVLKKETTSTEDATA